MLAITPLENGEYKMVTVSLGTKKKVYRSIKEMAAATGVPYMTLYMRLRMGTKPLTAGRKPVRKYAKRSIN